jgi:hypothetical protein
MITTLATSKTLKKSTATDHLKAHKKSPGQFFIIKEKKFFVSHPFEILPKESHI